MDSILASIKKLLGIAEDYTIFDQDIIVHINSVLNVLSQVGVTTADGVYLTDATTKWADLFAEGDDLELIKTYIYLRVRMIFDPPTGAVAESYKETIKELEWRIFVKEDPYE